MMPMIGKFYVATKFPSDSIAAKFPSDMFEVKDVDKIRRWNGMYYAIKTRTNEVFTVRDDIWEKYFKLYNPLTLKSGWYVLRKIDKNEEYRLSRLSERFPRDPNFYPFWIEIKSMDFNNNTCKIVINNEEDEMTFSQMRCYFSLSSDRYTYPEDEVYKFKDHIPCSTLQEGQWFTTHAEENSLSSLRRTTLNHPFYVQRIFRNPDFDYVIVDVTWKIKYDKPGRWETTSYAIYNKSLNKFNKLNEIPQIQPASHLMHARAEEYLFCREQLEMLKLNLNDKVSLNDALSFTVKNEEQRLNAIEILQKMKF